MGNVEKTMKKLFACFLLFAGFSSFAFAAQHTEKELTDFILSSLPSIEGWCSREKAINFVDLVLEVKPEICVEIGVFGGSSLFPVASTLKFLEQGFIIAIDPWDKTENQRHLTEFEDRGHVLWWSKINFEEIHASYKRMLKIYQLEDYCVTLRMTSEKAVPWIWNIDILYIDGAHSEEAIKKDVVLYLPKVREGGYIWLNDTLWEQSQPAIELLLQECNVVKLIDNGNCILFQKAKRSL